MNKNLKKLGFGDDDRVLIIHADDIGMCHATIPAFSELLDFGLVTSGSIMPPCPWTLAAVEQFKSDPRADLGIHLTLTSEWESYRWRPVATHAQTNRLLDHKGYFHSTSGQLHSIADIDTVALELNAQVDLVKQLGLNVTHIDNHMFALTHPSLFALYIELSLELNLPALVTRLQWQKYGFSPQQAKRAELDLVRLQKAGLPVFDNIYVLGKRQSGLTRLQQVENIIDNLPAGLSMLLLHPAKDTPELRAIVPDWKLRVDDYHTFSNPVLREKIAQSNINLIQYKGLLPHVSK